LGWAARWLMAYDEAKNLYEQSLGLSRLYHNHMQLIIALESLGFLALFLGRLDEAIQRFREGVVISKEMGRPQRGIDCQIHTGMAQWLSGNLAQARSSFDETLSLLKQYPPSFQVFSVTCYAEYLTMIGDYRRASEQLQIVNALSQDILLDRFVGGRVARVRGWVALAQKNYREARTQFEKSTEIYQFIADDEQIAWSQAGLARAMMGLGNWDEALQLLVDALWTSIEIKGFIPMIFTLPMTVLFLARENPDEALTVYQNLRCSPFLAKAQYIEDIVYRFLPDEIIRAPREMTIPEGDLHRHLWSTAASVLSKWMYVWMEESDVAQDEKSK
jgi:tetratricopeptide (TPR) repeat protein